MTKNLIKQMMKTVAEENKILDKQALIDKINSGYIAKREPKHQTKKTFAPSTLTWGHGECARYWYLAFSGNVFESTDTPYSVANMTSGTKSHERIQQALLDAEIAQRFPDEKWFDETGKHRDTTEFKVINSDPPIYGYGDAMLNWENDEIVGEIKTMNAEAFEYHKVHGKPKISNVMQLLIYMKVLKKSKGVLIYENKNNHDLLVFPIEVNDIYIEWVEKTFGWMRRVRQSWKDKQIPQKNYRSNSKICKGCPLKAACALAEPGTVKIEPLEKLSEVV